MGVVLGETLGDAQNTSGIEARNRRSLLPLLFPFSNRQSAGCFNRPSIPLSGSEKKTAYIYPENRAPTYQKLSH
jgi:hypothetical protein